ncbi:ABC transporter ATP-binding protein [Paenibacillus alvei]|uniref:ABC transporter ATP-binding protein n=1 Tax=Paenibacillus alvei TaxID=44250 RepID=UPI0004064D54|nr:ATP-binding cassette domain-containing protein [Paenibacillus alvei]
MITYLVQGLGALPYHFSQFKMAAGVTSHLFEVLDEKTERKGGWSIEITKSVPAIQFSGVSFSYDGRNNVLNDVSFILPQGKTVALVGSSGSGKSTLFKLIAGYFEPQQGSIKLYDKRLDMLELSEARSMISMVSQETYLYPYSIAENIAGGGENVSMVEIVKSAKMANIDSMIESMPNRYETLVGERGVKFSGGEKQRISIARAIMKDAPILLLDEPTSALDAESEKMIKESIKNLMKSKTILVAAHRLSTIVEADAIIVLENGKIVERGTHEELLEMKGVYFRVYNDDFSK